MKCWFKSGLIALCLTLIGIAASPAPPELIRIESDTGEIDNSSAEIINPQEPSWLDHIDVHWGGRFKATGAIARASNDTFLAPVASGNLYDGSADLRLINETFFSEWFYFEGAYELILSGGDTRQARAQLRERFAGFPSAPVFVSAQLNDDRRLMDLTDSIKETDDYILFQRLDRLFLALLPQWGSIRIGRQAITWGNGLVFNPMDLFNPFAPTQIDRDYKVGDDMLATQFAVANLGDVQALYVPRRNPDDNDIQWNQSALAAKLHFGAATTEFDVMVAKNYDDLVGGLGTSGYLADAAWRLDATWTYVDDDNHDGRDDFFSLVANMDYSWVWRGKNFYGFIEYYYNGLGVNDYGKAVFDPDISERLLRGNLFALGKNFLSSQIQAELHPLFNVYLTAINNVEDPSGALQPRAIWDVRQNLQLTLGANIFWGDKGTEYGGFIIPGTDLRSKTPNNVYLWMIYYF
jgi:hypothetical protein